MYLLLSLATLGWLVHTQHASSRPLLIFYLIAISVRWSICAVTVRVYQAELDRHGENRLTRLLAGGFNLAVGYVADDAEQLALGGAQVGSAVIGRESKSLRMKREHVENANRYLVGFAVVLAIFCCSTWWWIRSHTF
jgi:hypothetical protein